MKIYSLITTLVIPALLIVSTNGCRSCPETDSEQLKNRISELERRVEALETNRIIFVPNGGHELPDGGYPIDFNRKRYWMVPLDKSNENDTK